MQYHISESRNNSSINKLYYILKKKKIDFLESNNDIKIILKKYNINLNIFHNKYIPEFIILDNNENNIISNVCENINMSIDNFETIEDIIFEILLNISKISKIKKENKKDTEKFNLLLEEQKKKFLEDNKELHSKLKLFSLRSCTEMLGDQIIKLYSNKNFDIDIDNFLNIKIDMKGFMFKNAEELIITINMKINIDINYPPEINIISNKILKDNILKVISYLKPFSDLKAWSIKYSIYDSVINIFNMINIYGEINKEFTNDFDRVVYDLEYLLSIKNNNISENKLLELFDKDLIANNSNNSNNLKDDIYWKKGTGYGYNGTEKWNIELYIKNINEKKNKIGLTFIKFIDMLTNNNNKYLNNDLEYINRIINLLISYLENEEVSNINVVLISNFIYSNLEKINCLEKKKTNMLFNLLKNNLDLNDTSHKLFESKEISTIDNDVNIDEFNKIFKKYIFISYAKKFNNYYYKNTDFDSEKLYRLNKEFNIIKKSIVINSSASIFFWVEKNQLNKMRFIISGPLNTPYENGLYIFDMTITNEFPKTPPTVHFSNNGGKRFNPNLYDSGKVCLSLLGTWSGDIGETWNSQTSSFLQILLSIQSQILIEEPYFNEPGYEKTIGKQNGINNSKNYNKKIRKYNLDHAINNLLEGAIKKTSVYPEFDEIIINYFKFKKENIINTINKWESDYISIYEKNDFNILKDKFINLVNNL